MATLTFLGATGQVTGSCYLLQTESGSVLLDCGMYQGGRKADELNQADFEFEPADIDAVVLSHAHLDHSGRLPRLAAQGFNGPVYMTDGSYLLVDLLLRDAAALQKRDVEWENKRRQRARKKPVDALYSLRDVESILQCRKAYPYHQGFQALPDVTVCFYDAGHILGSAIVKLTITEGGNAKTLIFSGDLGNPNSPLLNDPEVIDRADYLLLESTYGDRDHKPLQATLEEFREVLTIAGNDGGNVIIPSFAVGRTQDLFYWLGKFQRQGDLPQNKIFLDSPMAIRASTIYEQHHHLFNNDDPEFRAVADQGWRNWLPGLDYAETTEESMAINRIEGGAIIIAGSGMCTGGRIRHHLKYNLWRRNAHIIFVGYQAQGTLGRELIDGKRHLKLLGSEIGVAAEIHTLGGLSAHADQSQLLQWVENFNTVKPEIYLVHGEPAAALSLQTSLQRNGLSAQVAELRQTITL